MRAKVIPDDFRVEEVLEPPGGDGPYALYVVEKRDLDTLALLREVASALGLSPSRVKAPAMKDKRAVARQYLSAGPGRGFPVPWRGGGFAGGWSVSPRGTFPPRT